MNVFIELICVFTVVSAYTFAELIPSMSLSAFNQTISDGSQLFKRKECRSLRKKHRVKPGTSWGTLTTAQQDHWMELGCDQFFCQPNELAGKGVYKCIPLRDRESRMLISNQSPSPPI